MNYYDLFQPCPILPAQNPQCLHFLTIYITNKNLIKIANKNRPSKIRRSFFYIIKTASY